MGDPGEESDSWQDEDGFQEVVSRKTRKHRQEQEAAAKAAIEAKAVELLKKERAAASVSITLDINELCPLGRYIV